MTSYGPMRVPGAITEERSISFMTVELEHSAISVTQPTHAMSLADTLEQVAIVLIQGARRRLKLRVQRGTTSISKSGLALHDESSLLAHGKVRFCTEGVGNRRVENTPVQMRIFALFAVVLMFRASVHAQNVVPARAASGPVAAPSAPASAGSILDVVEKIAKLAGYVIGGAWVYFNYFKGRTYRPRLETKVTGELSRQSTPNLIRATIQLKNVGLGKVDIGKRGTALRILAFDVSAADGWRHIKTLPILERHAWVEPDELIEEQALWPLDLKDIPAVKLEVIVTGIKTMWEANTISM